MTWQDQAACVGTDPDLFFPEKRGPNNTVEAKKICAGCPVRVPCGEHGVRHETFGVWGGMSGRELRRERRRRGITLRAPEDDLTCGGAA